MSRVAILVLGMHRSGTSALTWLLGQLGAALPGDGIGATADNAHGYFESAGLVKADDQLLRVARSSWFDPRPLDLSRLSPSALRSRRDRIREAIEAGWGAAPLLAIKDPRQCRFAGIVAGVLAEMAIEARAVLMLRPPAAIAASLARRDGTGAAYAHLLWLRHMIAAERDTRGMMRAVVDYDAMLADWRGAVARLAPLAGREGVADAAAVDGFLDPDLRHFTGEPAALERPLAGIVAGAEAALAMLAAGDEAGGRGGMDDAVARIDAAPWLAGDIVHDELRHRRMPAPDAVGDAVEGDPDPGLFPGAGRGPVGKADVTEDDASSRRPPTGPRPAPGSSIALETDATPPAPAPAAPAPAPDGVDDDAGLIRASGLFDADWYRASYPDAAASGLDPVEHYLRVGAGLGHWPNPLFDTGYYARQMARLGIGRPEREPESGQGPGPERESGPR